MDRKECEDTFPPGLEDALAEKFTNSGKVSNLTLRQLAGHTAPNFFAQPLDSPTSV